MQVRGVMVLCAPQVDVSCTDFHPVEQTECILSTRIISILTEAIALGVLLSSLLHQMETLKTTVALQQVFDLIFSVLLGKPTDEKFARSIVDLS